MPIPSTPDFLPSPIGGDVLPIPATTPTGTGELSYAQGWPVLTGLPLEAGGVAPQREFFNAVNALVSKHLFFLQSGGVYPWQAGLNYLTGWSVLVGGTGYVALQPSGPDVPEVGPKSPADSPEYWRESGAVPIATTLVPGISLRATAEDIAAKTAPDKTVSPADLAGITMDQWAAKVIAERFAIQTHLVGAEIPPNEEGGPRFIKLTAGDAYNAGLLSGETVTGTTPLITATAVIDLAESPLYGQTVHLLNTEGRFPRAGESGVIQDDAMQGHLHSMDSPLAYGGPATGPWSNGASHRLVSATGRAITDGTNGTPRVASETRARNIAETSFMRIF